MKKRFIPILTLIAYTVLLLNIIVFKNMPMIRIGPLVFKFGGTQAGAANFIPFKTILPYLLGEKGFLVSFINLAGNIALLMPIGFLVPFIYREMNWKKSLMLAFAAGFAMEGAEALLHVGIFDIDDVILNALGVMTGFWAFKITVSRVSVKRYNNTSNKAVTAILAAVMFCGIAMSCNCQQPAIPILNADTV